jgi:DNA-binding MarR family transcriptional regulator
MHVQRLHGYDLTRQQLCGAGIIAAVSTTHDEADLVAAWHDVSACHSRVSFALEKALEREHGLGLSEFEVLERLATQSKDDCRMQELAGAVSLSQSALSRLIGRLEADGLVTRVMCEVDRRGIFAHITEAGRARYEAARPTHRAVLAETMPARV